MLFAGRVFYFFFLKQRKESSEVCHVVIKAQDCAGHGLLLNNCRALQLSTCMAPGHIWYTAQCTHRQPHAHSGARTLTHT